MTRCRILLDAIVAEDRLLRSRLASCPRSLREAPAPGGTLNYKETLGHIAFWDDFAVNFFRRKLDRASCPPRPPDYFEKSNCEAIAAMANLPFGEVLARYLEATGALLEFLEKHWKNLSAKERGDFWVPLKHRRHHREELFRILDQQSSGGAELAAGA